jgi:acetylglutamate kinase
MMQQMTNNSMQQVFAQEPRWTEAQSAEAPTETAGDAAVRARMIGEMLPFLRQWHGKTVVIKYGGAAMTDAGLKSAVMGDIALLHLSGVRAIVVHGGGPEISETCRAMNIEPRFEQGMRVTDPATMRVTEMVLGQIGKDIALGLGEKGAPAVALSGKDAGLLRARKLVGEADWGLVGEVEHVDATILNALADQNFVPVVSPIAPGPSEATEAGQGTSTYNINADLAASALATALKAEKLLLLTDVAGVYRDFEDKTSLLDALSIEEAEELASSGVLSKGMIPKVRCCVDAVRGGVRRAHIIDGRAPHAILIELFTATGCGTMISNGE